MKEIKNQILSELDSRINRLKEHEHDKKPCEGNQYAELNHAVSHVIGCSLEKELTDIKDFVKGL